MDGYRGVPSTTAPGRTRRSARLPAPGQTEHSARAILPLRCVTATSHRWRFPDAVQKNPYRARSVPDQSVTQPGFQPGLAGVGGMPGVQRLAGHRAREQVALRGVAAQASRQANSFDLLPPSGDAGQAQTRAYVDGRVQDRVPSTIVPRAGNEGPDDLPLGEGQPSELLQ